MSESDSAVGYTRLSQESDTSIERQKRHIRAYADEHGLTLQRIYDDGERASGFETESREEYQQLRERVRSGEVGVVIVNDKRRLARDFDETMRLVLDARQEDVEIHTYQDGQLDVSDPMQAAVEVLQAASEHESKLKEIERAREAVQERIDRGYDHGRPRFGMTYNEDKTKQVPGEDFDKVMEILRLRREGATYAEIADELDGVSSSTAQRVVDRSEWYIERTKLEEAA